MAIKQKLTITNHSRDIAGLTYIYPVISRRAGGLSIGINFNTNNACNWQCVYCQVPDLIRGSAPVIDFQLLETELRFFLNHVLNGDFYNQFNVEPHLRVIKDIAISGNGEPTSAKDLDKAIQLIAEVATELKVLPHSQFVLITNGSLIYQQSVQRALHVFHQYQGKVWFKLDAATEQGRQAINGTQQTHSQLLKNLALCRAACTTYLQVCLLEYQHAESERIALIELLTQLKQNGIHINTILLYSIARPSMQAQADKVSQPTEVVMQQFANQLYDLGYKVQLSL